MGEKPVVLVTGTSRGIGNHLARHFVERGWAVVGCSRSPCDELAGPGYTHHLVDLASERDVMGLFRSIRREHGRLDVVINNAANTSTRALIALTPMTAAVEVLAVNVLGPLLVCREAVKLMLRRRYGRIVNVGSAVTEQQIEGEALYTASKAALHAMTCVLAKEVGEHGITCNVVAPGLVETETMAALDSAELRAAMARNALPEVSSPADVATAIDRLVSPAAAGITGQIVYLGGT